jgi:mRNA turnover protein 4
LFFGKTKVMAKALGSSAADEPAEGTHRLAPYLHGVVGLLFSPREPAAIRAFFDSFRPLDFARAGTKANTSFTIPAGIIYSQGGQLAPEDDLPLAGSIEPMLRKLGVSSSMGKGRELGGKVVLEDEHVVCKEGDTLGSAQTSLLKIFGVATAEFRVELRAVWKGATGVVEELEGSGDVAASMDVDGEVQDDDQE